MVDIRFLTAKEAAYELRTTPRHVAKLIRSGELKGRKVGREYRILEKYLIEYMNETMEDENE